MKIILFITCLFFSSIVFAQRTFDVTGIMANLTSPALRTGGISKTKILVIITDSTYSQTFEGKTTTFQIIKKVDENYFKVSDGLKDYIFRISEDIKMKKYKGMIVQEMPTGTISLFYN